MQTGEGRLRDKDEAESLKYGWPGAVGRGQIPVHLTTKIHPPDMCWTLKPQREALILAPGNT